MSKLYGQYWHAKKEKGLTRVNYFTAKWPYASVSSPVGRIRTPEETPPEFWRRLFLLPVVVLLAPGAAAALPEPVTWPFMAGMGGVIGDGVSGLFTRMLGAIGVPAAFGVSAVFCTIAGAFAYAVVCGLTRDRAIAAIWALEDGFDAVREFVDDRIVSLVIRGAGAKGADDEEGADDETIDGRDAGLDGEPALTAPRRRRIIRKKTKQRESRRERREAQPVLPVFSAGDYELPPLNLLARPNGANRTVISDDALEQNARMLENVLSDFGVTGANRCGMFS